MRRQIKFRGKLRDGGRWVYGSLLTWPDGDVYILYDKDFEKTEKVDKQPVIPETVGQFTEMYDKVGKEIYEGDIVECVSWNEYFTNPDTGEFMEPFRRMMYVEYRRGGFKMVEPMPKVCLTDPEWDMPHQNGSLEIKGNIHDNPDMLKNWKIRHFDGLK